METRLFEGRNEQRQQQSHQLPMNLVKRGGALKMLKQTSPAESLQRLMMQQARSQSGGL